MADFIKQLETEYGIELEKKTKLGLYDRAYVTDENQNIVGLSLYKLKIKNLSQSILKLINLKTLALSRNQITELPDQITRLINLKTLALDGNQITELPDQITRLINLETLALDGNQITELPDQITRLINLKTLYLSRNQITELPDQITRLINLETLALSDNQITELPDQITRLINLETLALSDNQITELPDQITRLINLKILALSDNPIKEPPPEIVNQGIKAVFEYLNQEKKMINEAKLILVGQGEVGKTCLAERLIHNKFQEQKSTEGIDILDWKIKAPTEEEIKLNVWDFGGQEIYHATHQFFLTKRSVYILVWNARRSRDYENIYYWLHIIEAFGEDSPVIVLMTKCRQRDDDLNEKDLKERFPKIAYFLKADSKDGKGIDALKEAIGKTAWNLPQMNEKWLKPWLSVRQELENLKEAGKNWVRYDEFLKISKKHGLNQEQTDILDRYLHDLGVIIHFRDRIGLKNMVILNPEWATDAVYKIIDTGAVRERNGVLLHSELEEIWDTEKYPHDIHPRLLELMNRFELAYELPDKKSHLIAEMLNPTEPNLDWDKTDNLCFYYRYDFLPAGVITRFIVRMHDYSGKVWREGTILDKKGTKAFVRVRPLKKKVEIRISGKNSGDKSKRELLAVIRSHFDEINRNIKKVKVVKKIPCNCSEKCENTFDYERLLDAETKGKQTVECQQSWEDIDLSVLLDGYRREDDKEILLILKQINNRLDDQTFLLEKAQEIVKLQPNFFGFGVDLRAIDLKKHVQEFLRGFESSRHSQNW